MTASLRLFAIETRRNVGLWAVPVLAGLAWLAWRIQQDTEGRAGVALWPQTSVDIGFAVVFLGPAAGGLAAWVAGRDHRRGLGDLLATTPAPATRRELTLLAATALWALLAFLAAGVYLGVLTAREATWGGPVAAPILIGGLGIAVQAAIGYAVGSFAGSSLASRLLAGLVPVGLFFAELLPTLIQGDDVQLGPNASATTEPYENLSPVSIVQNVGGSVFWAPPMEIAGAGTVWLLGLGGLALAIVALRRRRRSPVAWGTLGAAALAIVVGRSQLVPAPVWAVPEPSRAIAYEPVCAQRSIPICVHPAYESVLNETADLVDPIVRPLAGMAGFPVRAVQLPPALEGMPGSVWAPWSPDATAADTLPVSPDCANIARQTQATGVAVAAVQIPAEDAFGLTPAQSAIVLWLLRQAGWDATAVIEIAACVPFGVTATAVGVDDATRRAADRFGALPPEEQRAWLDANFAALRVGELTLEDLP